jgi:amino acid transporter
MVNSDQLPAKTLSVSDSIIIIVGVVIGAGIFKTPSLVAANSGSVNQALSLWLAGGAVTFAGALCYAELSSTYPHSGGEYHFITRAFGSTLGFLFAWARITVIQTGSIAMLGFVIGDYASGIFHLGLYSSSQYAAITIISLTAVNAAGLLPGKRVQRLFIAALIAGLFLVAAAGLLPGSSPPISAGPAAAPLSGGFGALGQAMIFVLLTFGGWNEAAYLSAEVRNPSRNMVRVLLGSISLITLIYLGINFALFHSLGLSGVATSQTPAADLMSLGFGEAGAGFISLLIIVAAVSTMNATIMTGARSGFALGRDFPILRWLGKWDQERDTPINALLIQGVLALFLVVIGSGFRNGFEAMIEYTAPVFWFFVLLTGISLLVLRRREPEVPRPFCVPWYPFTPLLFCSVCIFMLVSSFLHTGRGALFGVIALAAGVPLLWLMRSVGTTPLPERERRKETMKKVVLPLAALAVVSFVLFSLTGKQNTKTVQLDVPYVPTPTEVVDEMLNLAQIRDGDVLFDLGSGDGRIVITAAQRWNVRGVGIEIDPMLVRISRQKAAWAGVDDRTEFIESDLFKSDFSRATVVTLYLLPDLNLRLRPKLFRELRPGTRVISHSFDMAEWVPDKTALSATYWDLFIDYDTTKHSSVYLWIMPANISGLWQGENPADEFRSLKVSQRFQKAEGVISDAAGERAASVEVRGETVRIRSDVLHNGKVVPVLFEGQVQGETIEGNVFYGREENGQGIPWKMFRQPATKQAIEG